MSWENRLVGGAWIRDGVGTRSFAGFREEVTMAMPDSNTDSVTARGGHPLHVR
jgi:hypothetical protein